MTPDEMVRAIHRLEGEVEKIKTRLAGHYGNQQILVKRFDALLSQQNQLLAAIRGMEAPVAPVA